MDKNNCHGCITLFNLSIVIILCTVVRHNIPLQKAHMICKMVEMSMKLPACNYISISFISVEA